tara:strand:+ start:13589 stop:13945 length:357 start_codon:yes stop_codon:yes gene_type:complete
MLNSINHTKKQNRIKMRIKKGDTVQVIHGKEKGKIGEVTKIFPYENRVIVKGINIKTKHQKPSQEGESGKITTEESSVHASNIMIYSKEKKVASKVEYFIDKDGVKKRRLKKTGELID